METSNDPELPIFVTVLGKKPLTPVLNLNLNLTLNPRPRIVHGDHAVVGNNRPMDLRRARFEKGRRWKTVPVGQKSLMKNIEDTTASAVTSGKSCPDPFAPATSRSVFSGPAAS